MDTLPVDFAVKRSGDTLSADSAVEHSGLHGGECSIASSSFFDWLLAGAIYETKEGFVLPSFLAAALDTAFDLQGRSLRELLQQALEEEPCLAPILGGSGSAESSAASTISPAESRSFSVDIQRKNGYWKALIRGGLQGLLYRYDCEKA